MWRLGILGGRLGILGGRLGILGARMGILGRRLGMLKGTVRAVRLGRLGRGQMGRTDS
jgi:hypothetical protein